MECCNELHHVGYPQLYGCRNIVGVNTKFEYADVRRPKSQTSQTAKSHKADKASTAVQ